MRVFAIVLMLVVCGSVVVPRIRGQCGGNFLTIQWRCERYYRPEGEMIPPSQACCEALRNVNVSCMCNLAASYEDYFSPEKAVYVLRQCGNSVPSGTQCGTYIAPPPPPPL